MTKKDEISKEIGARVRFLRKELALTLEELSARMGVSVPHLASMERGEKRWPDERIVQAATALGVSPGALIHLGIPEDQIGRVSEIIGALEGVSDSQIEAVLQMLKAFRQQ